jgi:monoamine oxidase
MLKRLRRAFHLARLANRTESQSVSEALEISRRRFLQTGGAALGAVALAGCGSDEQFSAPGFTAPNRAGQPQIAILGAGIAGLNAAWQLYRAGFSSTIYEAQDRIGGRMFTAKDIFGPGLTTELGGEFIDSNHFEMLELVREFGLPLVDVFAPSELALNQTTWYFGGVHLSEADVIALFQPLEPRITADQDSLADEINFMTRDAATVALDRLSIAEYLDQIGASGTIRTILDVAFETEHGLAPAQLSALDFLVTIDPDTSDGDFRIYGDSDQRYKILGGNQTLPQAMAARIQDVSPVQLGHRLTALRQDKDRFALTFSAAGGSRDVLADLVVCTLPFSVLRDIDVRVDLPDDVRNSIQALPYGTNSKLTLGFQSRFWRNQGSTGLFFTDLPFQSGWDSTQGQPGTGASLTLYLGGNPGVQLANGTPASWAEAFLPGINQIFPGADTQFTGEVRRFTWHTFPFALGSYSGFGPGQITTQLGVANQLQGNLFFAGEHTSESDSGFMEGGAESGRRAAEQILERLGAAPVVRARRPAPRRFSRR